MNSDKTLQNKTAYFPSGIDVNVSDLEYAYNGKEKISSHGFNMYDYGARFYDQTISRWHSMDPLAEKYYSISPYAYCANNPVKYIDPDGRKIEFAADSHHSFKEKFAAAVKYLNETNNGGLLYKMQQSEKTFIIEESFKDSRFVVITNTKDNTTVYKILWNPNLGMKAKDTGYEMSPAEVINHEAAHAVQYDENQEQYQKDHDTENADYKNEEEKRVITGPEQETAKKMGKLKDGEVTRATHKATPIIVVSPINTEKVLTVQK